MKLDWQVCYIKDNIQSDFAPAQVPGAVQTDLAHLLQLPDYRFGDNYKQYKIFEEMSFKYRATIPKLTFNENQRVFFVSKGIDYEYTISINGHEMLHDKGMYHQVTLDITEHVKNESVIEILLLPPPKLENANPDTRDEAAGAVKPAVSYGWDFHPRIIPIGIWDETYIQIRNIPYITDCDFSYELNNSLNTAHINLIIHANAPASVRYRLYDGDMLIKELKSDHLDLHHSLENPKLWWCSGHGEQNLYRYEVALFNGRMEQTDCHTGIVGFRKIRLIPNEGCWSEPSQMPKTRSVPPITIELNNKRIFAKGSNIVNPEIFYGTITDKTYETLVNNAKDANFNILRCWGGAGLHKEKFYSLCDRAGIMIWQEFPLACNNYADSKEYLSLLDSESKSIINRLKSHPCHVLWCGGNELFNEWSKMTDQSKALRLLNKNCYELDVDKPFIPTSPLMGMSHGGYLFAEKEELFAVIQKSSCTAYTEFGTPSLCVNAEYLAGFMPQHEINGQCTGSTWEAHHAWGSWRTESWLCNSILERYFGYTVKLSDKFEQSHWLQSISYQCIFEEARRQSPYCSMALNWCFNEPWPCAANNSIMSYPTIKKPSFEAVKNALRPCTASLKFKKFAWRSGEVFDPELWFLNDTEKQYTADVQVYIIIEENKYNLISCSFKCSENIQGPTLRFKLPATQAKEFFLVAEWGEDSSATYRLKLN